MLDRLDPEIEKFIDRRIHSPLDIDILVYFHRSLIVVESPREIAKRLEKNIKDVAKSLYRFESRGILHNMSTGRGALYTYSASDNLHIIVERFVKLVSSQQGREMVDHKLIAKGKI